MLNQRTTKDAYALPRIEEIYDILHGSQYFSVLDMKSGYHQVEVEEAHKERTAFTVGSLGFFEFNKMPFGLSNSPATYQRLMEDCLGDYNNRICVIYLDDIVIFANSFEEHLRRLDLVLARLRECKLKVSADKCFFFQRRVKFLGHVISDQGIETDPEKINKIKNWPIPSNPDELRSFLAFAGYYRRFIQNFSKIAKPLADLLPPTSPKKKGKAKKTVWRWEQEHQEVFNRLKESLITEPILGYPDFTLPFELHVDASGQGLGAVLYQEQDGKKRVIAYASRSLSKSEKNYPAHKLEFLALKWSITEKFSDYLIHRKFRVYTDNNPLTHVLTTAKLDATGQRWVAALAQYNFDLIYKPGTMNVDADIMSRYPIRSQSGDEIVVEDSTVKAICNVIHSPPLIEILPINSINVLDIAESSSTPMAQVEIRELRNKQREDPVIGIWYRAVMDKKLPRKNAMTGDSRYKIMSRHYKQFFMNRGVLYRKTEQNNQTVNQIVLPECFKETVLRGIHNDMGHPGKERSVSLVRNRFYWPGYTVDCEKWVEKCDRCLRRKSSVNIRAPLVSIESSYPLEMVCIDYLTVEPCKGNIENILVITDHFTKFSIAVPTRNQTAKTTAEVLVNNFFFIYGIPTGLHADQGANFESELVAELCKLLKIEKSRTTPYHPQGNGQTERYNRTLLDMLGTLESDQKRNWKAYIPSLVYAYNAIPHESTGYAPFELMFGRKPKLSIDVLFEGDQSSERSSDYVKDLEEKMRATREAAKQTLAKAKLKQKSMFDKKARAAELKVGDTVLVKVLAYQGRHKIADKFEESVYRVVGHPNTDIPVYIVESEDGNQRKLHRNHLLPVAVEDKKVSVDRVKRKVNRGRQLYEKLIFEKRCRDSKSETQAESEEEDLVYTVETEEQDDTVKENNPLVDDENVEQEHIALEEGNVPQEDHVAEADHDLEEANVPEQETVDADDNVSEEGDISVHEADDNAMPRRSSRVKKAPDRYQSSQQTVINSPNVEYMVDFFKYQTEMFIKLCQDK